MTSDRVARTGSLANFDFRMRPAPDGLAEVVESVWYARGTVPYESEQISPTGSTVGVIVLGDPIEFGVGDGPSVTTRSGFLAGPHDRPALNRPLGETFAVGIVTTAVGCEPVFGVDPASIRGRAVSLEASWPPTETLRSSLGRLRDPESILDTVLTTVRESVGPVDARRRRCAGWVAELASHATLPIRDLADSAELTHAHLVAEFNRHVGLTPRMLSRILRLRAVIAEIDIEPTGSWTDIAHRYDWFDQAHFIRDFKRHTGVTPSDYVAAQRATYEPGQAIAGSGVGFVPDT